MGLVAPRKRSRQSVAPQKISDNLPAPSQRHFQPSETATTIRATSLLPTKLLAIQETPATFSSPVLAEAPSSAHTSAVALGIVFGVFFGTIIFSFIVWRLCRRRSTTKTSTSTWPSSAKAATTMPVRYSSTMRYPHRPAMARIRNGDREKRAAPSEEVEKGRTTPKVVKVIQSDAPVQSSKRNFRPLSHGTGRPRHHRDLSVSRHREFPHPGRQAVVDVSSPTTEEWETHDVHPPKRSRHKYDDLDDRPAVRGRYGQDNPYHPPPLIYIAGREAHERSSRRSHEQVLQRPQRHGQVAHERRRIRRSQPTSVSVVQASVPTVHATSISAPAIPTSTRRYQPPRYESTSSATSSLGLSDNIGEEPPSFTSSSSSSSSSEEGRSWSRRRSRSQSPARVRFTLPSGVGQYLDAD